ncbi:MAG: hypothetical protein ACOC1X_03725 [Promethearchaeota archaeon]
MIDRIRETCREIVEEEPYAEPDKIRMDPNDVQKLSESSSDVGKYSCTGFASEDGFRLNEVLGLEIIEDWSIRQGEAVIYDSRFLKGFDLNNESIIDTQNEVREEMSKEYEKYWDNLLYDALRLNDEEDGDGEDEHPIENFSPERLRKLKIEWLEKCINNKETTTYRGFLHWLKSKGLNINYFSGMDHGLLEFNNKVVDIVEEDEDEEDDCHYGGSIIEPVHNTILKFKSTPENYEKEKSGLKPNTVRKFGYFEEDKRESILIDYMNDKINNLGILIVNSETGDSFVRTIKDVTKWKGEYIISWEEE